MLFENAPLDEPIIATVAWREGQDTATATARALPEPVLLLLLFLACLLFRVVRAHVRAGKSTRRSERWT